MSSTISSEGPVKKKIRRSRLGCHLCKSLKIKCTEERPLCSNCTRIGKPCDYSLKLTWGGRPYKNKAKRKPSPFVDLVPQDAAPPLLDTPAVVKFVSSKFDVKPHLENGSPLSKHVQVASSVSSSQSSHVEVKVEPIDESEPLAAFSHAHDPPSSLDILGHGHTPLSLRNSEIFNSFMNTQLEQPITDDSLQNPVHSPLLADLYDNYSADIARIEDSFPEVPKNLVPEMVHPTQWSKKSPSFFIKQDPETKSPSLISTPTPPNHDPLIMHKSLDEEHELAIINSMERIPPPLTPLPELLMNVPYYRQLLHFWVNVASANLVPAPSHIYQENPFKVLLPQMAMHYPGVLTTILAFAARARDNMDGASRNHLEIIDQLLGRSCNELLKQLHDKEESTSDGTLATILLLSCYEVVNSNDFEKHRTHTTGASQIVSARRIKQQPYADSPTSDKDSVSSASSNSFLSKMRDESDIAFFLMRWFAYVDVLGALSSTRGRENYLRSYRTKGPYTPVVNISTLDINSAYMGNHKTDIDYLLGFDVRLLPHYINISLLIDEVDKLKESEDANRNMLPIEIITAALELKERFIQGYEDGEENRQKTIDLLIESKLKVKKSSSPRSTRNISELVRHDNILRATNKLFFDTGLLNLYRRVLLLPRLSPLVQDLADNMAEILEYGVELGSPAEICTIFCHFCAACETLDMLKRQFFFERFTRLAHDGNINATKSLVIMNRCWETGEDWITAANVLDIDLVLM